MDPRHPSWRHVDPCPPQPFPFLTDPLVRHSLNLSYPLVPADANCWPRPPCIGLSRGLSAYPAFSSKVRFGLYPDEGLES